MNDPTQDPKSEATGEPVESALSRLRRRAEDPVAARAEAERDHLEFLERFSGVPQARERDRLEFLERFSGVPQPEITPTPEAAVPEQVDPGPSDPDPETLAELEPLAAPAPAPPPWPDEPEAVADTEPLAAPQPWVPALPAQAAVVASADTVEELSRGVSRGIWRFVRQWIAFWITVSLIVASLAPGVFLFLRARQVDHRKALREEARLTAATVAEAVTTLDYKRLDDWLARTQAVSTGGLRDDFATRKNDLATIVTPEELVATGKAVRETAELVEGDQVAQCLVSLDRTSVTKDLPAGQHELQRYVVRLKRVNGAWLATFVNPVAVGL